LDELIRDRLRTGTPDELRNLAGSVLDATYSLFGTRQRSRSRLPT
jgi:hypothetical protein